MLRHAHVCLQIFAELEQELDDTIDSFNYTSDSFLDDDARSALNDFTSAGVDAINITVFNETLSASILAFNLTETINSLQSLQMDLVSKTVYETDAGQPAPSQGLCDTMYCS